MYTQFFKLEAKLTKPHLFPQIFIDLFVHNGSFQHEIFHFFLIEGHVKENKPYSFYIS